MRSAPPRTSAPVVAPLRSIHAAHLSFGHTRPTLGPAAHDPPPPIAATRRRCSRAAAHPPRSERNNSLLGDGPSPRIPLAANGLTWPSPAAHSLRRAPFLHVPRDSWRRNSLNHTHRGGQARALRPPGFTRFVTLKDVASQIILLARRRASPALAFERYSRVHATIAERDCPPRSSSVPGRDAEAALRSRRCGSCGLASPMVWRTPKTSMCRERLLSRRSRRRPVLSLGGPNAIELPSFIRRSSADRKARAGSSGRSPVSPAPAPGRPRVGQ